MRCHISHQILASAHTSGSRIDREIPNTQEDFSGSLLEIEGSTGTHCLDSRALSGSTCLLKYKIYGAAFDSHHSSEYWLPCLCLADCSSSPPQFCAMLGYLDEVKCWQLENVGYEECVETFLVSHGAWPHLYLRNTQPVLFSSVSTPQGSYTAFKRL